MTMTEITITPAKFKINDTPNFFRNNLQKQNGTKVAAVIPKQPKPNILENMLINNYQAYIIEYPGGWSLMNTG